MILIIVAALQQCPIEYLEEPWVNPCLVDQVACSLPDLDQDGDVDVNDFLDLIGLWGPADCTVFEKGDINRDGEVGLVDMLIILEIWWAYTSDTWERCGCDDW